MKAGIVCEAWLTESNELEGYVYAEAAPSRRLTVEFVLDGYVIGVQRADGFVDRLWQGARGDGCYGFSYIFGELVAPAQLEIRLANDLGVLIRRELPATLPSAPPPLLGEVRWAGGLRLTGFVESDADATALSCVLDGAMIAQTRADGWARVARAGRAVAVRSFDIHLPQWVADGHVKSVRVFKGDGSELLGSPVEFVAFPDTLRSFLAQHDALSNQDEARLRVYEQIFPQSRPFGEWKSWAKRWLTTSEAEMPDVAVVLIGDDEAALARTLASLDQQSAIGWVATVLSCDDAGQFSHSDLVAFLQNAAAHCAVVLFSHVGAEFEPTALARLSAGLASDAEARLIYPDLVVTFPDGAQEVLAFPAFDHERLLEQGYCAHLFAVPKASLELLSATGTRNMLRMVLDLARHDRVESRHRLLHLPGPVATLPAAKMSLALAAEVTSYISEQGLSVAQSGLQESCASIRVRRQFVPKSMGVVLISDGDSTKIARWLDIIAHDALMFDCSIILVSPAGQSLELPYRPARLIELSCGGEFDRHRLLNLGLQQVNEELILLLDADVLPASDDWLAEMVGRMADADVALVGAVQVSADNYVTNGGYVTGPNFAAAPAFVGARLDAPTLASPLMVARETSAINLRSALLRRDYAARLEPFDEMRYPAELRDVDYCLRLREHGGRVLVTPHARFRSGRDDELDFARLSDHEQRQLACFRQRWQSLLLEDRFYNPMLNLDAAPYTGLAWPPRSLVARNRL